MREPHPVDPFVLRQLDVETEARARASRAVASSAAGAPDEVLHKLAKAVDGLRDELLTASHDLAEHPEVSFEEHRSAAALADLVEGHGVAVTRGAHGLETALRAEVSGGDGPTIAILSEYDALPGVGHGCGHNVIATAGLGAFLALAALAGHSGERLPGRVVWLGTPAEEGGGGKELMARDGAFDDIDAAVMVHPFGYDLAEPVFLGRRQLRVTYTGIAAHASIQPFMGRNALDAAHLLYTGVALNRQQMPPFDRVHAVISDGGVRPNVIPERAEVVFYVRSQYAEELSLLSTRLEEIAHGAALMTGCGVELAWDESPAYLPLRNNTPLAQAWNRRYAERGRSLLAAGVLPDLLAGSTDFGNVSFRIPGLHAMVKIAEPQVSLHSHEFAAAAVTEAADATVLDAAYGLAGVAADYLWDGELRQAVADDFAAAGGAVDVSTYFD
ncbi:M20 family metallopeptidase [Nocardioides sp. KR10-350]|uniref:M20 family metallopeptidase n=1 Tax=Nocardioides cheoyonin TaxID=3156615 RepID=UPI0032B4AF69